MKLNGFVGKGSGKLGASVFAISGGEQIVRQYNPQVANPNTDAQVAQRAKLKLMSQLAAALSSGIAFKKKGLVSARNQFVSKNIGITLFQESKAVVDLKSLQIAPGATYLPDLAIAQGQSSGWVLKLGSAAPEAVKRVVYVVCQSNPDEMLEIVEIKIGNTAGANRDFEVTTTSSNQGMFVLAYGVEDLNAAATAKYDTYVSAQGTTEAELLVDFLRNTSGYAYTMTKGEDVA